MRPIILSVALLASCSNGDFVEQDAQLSQAINGPEHLAMMSPGLPKFTERRRVVDRASLWNGGPQSLLGDRRAIQQGDILTVVIEIDDKAEISNSSSRKRDGSESMSVPYLLGLPQRVTPLMPDGATLDPAVSLKSSSSSEGDGSVRRKEKLTLRVAATITGVLPNGVLQVQGSQEVRVNFEVRELLVSGYVRPEDISRKNEITYDKIASARISYAGRGQITNVQKPRYGQQAVDRVLPF